MAASISHHNAEFATLAAGMAVLWGATDLDGELLFVALVAGLTVLAQIGLGASAVARFPVSAPLPESEALLTSFLPSAWWGGGANTNIAGGGKEEEAMRDLITALLFVCGYVVFGATGCYVVARRSPFLAALIWVVLLSITLRDSAFRSVSAVIGGIGQVEALPDISRARLALMFSVAISCFLSREVTKIVTAFLVISCLNSLVYGAGYPDHDFPRATYETNVLMCAVGCVLLHDAAVRYFLKPLTSAMQSLALAVTALIVVDTCLELAGTRPARLLSHSRWETSFVKSRQHGPLPGFALLPPLASVYCLATVVRTLRQRNQRGTLTWLQVQGVLGVGVGMALGIALWSEYVSNTRAATTALILSPPVVCIIAASVLTRTSAMLGDVVKGGGGSSTDSTDMYPIQYVLRDSSSSSTSSSSRGGGSSSVRGGNRSGKNEDALDGDAEFPKAILASSASALYSNPVRSAAQALVETEATLKDLRGAVPSTPQATSSPSQAVLVARRKYEMALCASMLVKNAEEMVARMGEVRHAAETELRALMVVDPGSTLTSKSRARVEAVQRELREASAYLSSKKKASYAADEEALKLLTAAIAMNEAPGGDAEAVDTLEALADPIRHRKRRIIEEQDVERQRNGASPSSSSSSSSAGAGGLTAHLSSGSSPAFSSSSSSVLASNAAGAGATNGEASPAVRSGRETVSSPASGGGKRSRFFLFGRKSRSSGNMGNNNGGDGGGDPAPTSSSDRASRPPEEASMLNESTASGRSNSIRRRLFG